LNSVGSLGDRGGFMRASALDVLLDEFVDRVAERVALRLRDRDAEPTTDLLSVSEAAQVLRCKPRRVYDLRSAGRLPRTVEGGRAVVRRSDIEKLVAEDDR
jgi:excisionase family DNA binding protein